MKPRFLKVKEKEFMYRDTESGAILNLDKTEYDNYKHSKQLARKKLEQEKQQENRLNNLESEVKQLKDGINQILELLKHES